MTGELYRYPWPLVIEGESLERYLLVSLFFYFFEYGVVLFRSNNRPDVKTYSLRCGFDVPF